MAPVIPDGVPAQLIAGDSLIFKRSYPLYPVSESWTIAFTFKGVGALTTTTGEVTNDSSATWTVNVPAARTAELPAGTYRWFATATGASTYAGRRDIAEEGVIVVKENPGTARAGDYQSHEEAELALINAALLAAASDADVVSYTIGNRQVTRSRQAAVRRKSQLERVIWRQQHPGASYPTSYGGFYGVN